MIIVIFNRKCMKLKFVFMLLKGQMVAAMNLGGALVWDIDTDDFRGICHGSPNILTRTIVNAMNGPTNLMPTNPCSNNIVF